VKGTEKRLVDLFRVIDSRSATLRGDSAGIPGRAKAKRVLTISTFGFLLAGLTVAGFALGQATLGGASPDGPSKEMQAAADEPEQSDARSQSEPTTETFAVASGTEAGEAWSLRAYRAEMTREGTDAQPALCLEWKYASTFENDDFNCFSDGTETVNGSLLSYFSRGPNGPPKSSFFGAVRNGTESVEVQLESGDVVDGQVFSVAELAPSQTFAVGFAEPKNDVVIVGYDEQGEVLWRQTKENP
jgi:hypothetical protein